MSRKLRCILTCALLFFVVASPWTYSLTDSLLSPVVGKLAHGGCPTTLGLVVHSLVFAVVHQWLWSA